MNKDIVSAQRALTEKDVFKKRTKKNIKETEEQLGTLAESWSYEQSAGIMKALVFKWKNMTVELMRGLWEAHYVLTQASREYQTSKLKQGEESPCVQNLTHGKTWAEYCDEIGISKQTAHNWLKRFVPRELSASGEDLLLTPEEVAQLSAESSEKTQAWIDKMVDEFERTQVRPPGWNQACENELLNRSTMRRVEEQVNDMLRAWQARPDVKQMTFFDEWIKANQVDDIRLPEPRLTSYQFKFFESIDDYLLSFSDIDIRAKAARNLAEKIRRRMNEDFAQQLLIEDQQGKDAEED